MNATFIVSQYFVTLYYIHIEIRITSNIRYDWLSIIELQGSQYNSRIFHIYATYVRIRIRIYRCTSLKLDNKI